MKNILLFLIIFCLFQKAEAQPNTTADVDARYEIIHSTLDASAQAGQLFKVADKHKFHGSLEYQLSYKKGGKVLHCRNLKADTQNNLFLSQFQKELLKAKVKLKIGKGEQLKLVHTFNIP